MPRTGRIFAIGDIHGCRIEFEHLLEKLELEAEDQVILLGDLINRGPDSAGVLRVAQELPNCRCLIGNHELRLLNYRRDSNPSWLKSYDWDTVHQLRDADWNFMSTFEATIEFPQIETVCVHGGFLPWLDWTVQPVEDIVEIQNVDPKTLEFGKRSHLTKGVSWQDKWQGPPFVVCGHTPRKDVYRTKAALCLDTGCVYGGRLTACELLSQKLIQVSALERYVGKPLAP
mgnify:CR=1 FL=1